MSPCFNPKNILVQWECKSELIARPLLGNLSIPHLTQEGNIENENRRSNIWMKKDLVDILLVMGAKIAKVFYVTFHYDKLLGNAYA